MKRPPSYQNGTAASVPELAGTPSTAIGGPVEGGGERLVSQNLAEEVRAAVRRAGFPGFSLELLHQLQERAVAEIVGAAHLVVDVTRSLTDRWAVEGARKHGEALAMAQTAVTTLGEQLHAARLRLTDVGRPWGMLMRFGVVVVLAALAAVGVGGVANFLAPSIEASMLGPFFERHGIGDDYAMKRAFIAAALIAAPVMVAPVVAVVVTWGRLHPLIKGGFIACGSGFSLFFGGTRLSEGASLIAAAISGLEMMSFLALDLVGIAVAPLLKIDAERRNAYQTAQAKVAVFEQAEATAKATAQELERHLAQQVKVLEIREQGTRRLAGLVELAKSTVAAVYFTELSAFIAEYSRNQSDQAFGTLVEGHLNDERQNATLADSTTKPGGSDEDNN